ncbi:kinase-like domain-containing protein [Phyllosticta citribraziliensis]
MDRLQGQNDAQKIVSAEERDQNPRACPLLDEHGCERVIKSILNVPADDVIDDIYWGPVMRISKSTVVELVKSHIDPASAIPEPECMVECIEQGAWNRAFLVRISSEKFILRVPSLGVRGVWNRHKALQLRSSALSMRWIRNNTRIPVPEVLAYDITHKNEIGHPFTLMRHVSGTQICDVWDDDDGSDAEFEAKRLRILDSVAETAAQLQTISFTHSGMLHFDDESATRPRVGLTYHLCEDGTDDGYDLPEDPDALVLLKGQHEILRLLVDCLPFARAQEGQAVQETFVLAHPDFDWQNIMVDDEGNVTGVIDWDCTRAVSRFLGYAALPLWLGKGYVACLVLSGSVWSSPERFQYYRAFYASAMAKAMHGKGDCAYTHKSILFLALEDALKYPNRTLCFLQKIVHLVLPGTDVMYFLKRIGTEGLVDQDKGLFQELFRCAPGADPRFPI